MAVPETQARPTRGAERCRCRRAADAPVTPVPARCCWCPDAADAPVMPGARSARRPGGPVPSYAEPIVVRIARSYPRLPGARCRYNYIILLPAVRRPAGKWINDPGPYRRARKTWPARPANCIDQRRSPGRNCLRGSGKWQPGPAPGAAKAPGNAEAVRTWRWSR